MIPLANERDWRPLLHDGSYAFCSIDAARERSGAIDLRSVIAWFREPEGLTVVLPETAAREQGLNIVHRAAWITLRTLTALDEVGVTATVAALLAQADISCNVIAGVYHDHLFVPPERAQEALEILQR
jgi:hypothetical protein